MVRRCSWQAISYQGINDNHIYIEQHIAWKFRSPALHPGKISEDFKIQTPVRQECILLPILFHLVIGGILQPMLFPYLEDAEDVNEQWHLPLNTSITLLFALIKDQWICPNIYMVSIHPLVGNSASNNPTRHRSRLPGMCWSFFEIKEE